MSAVLPLSKAPPLVQQAHWTDRIAHAVLLLVAIAAVRVPRAAAVPDPDQGAAGARRLVHRPRQLRQLPGLAVAAAIALAQRLGLGARHAGHGAARVRLRLRDDPQLHAVQGSVPDDHAGAAAGAVAAVGDLADLLVRQPGRGARVAASVRLRQYLRRARGRHRRVLRGIPACADDPDHRAVAGRCAPLRSRRRTRHGDPAALLHDHACRARSTA